eukprot:5623853-Prymnesium_polylepis.1
MLHRTLRLPTAALRAARRGLCAHTPPSPRTAYQAAVAAGELREDVHQLAAIAELERLHGELLHWKPPPPPPPPPPPKESKWKGPAMDAYGEPIGGGTFYTGVKNDDDGGGGLWGWLSGGGGGSDDGEPKEPDLATGVAAPRGVYVYGGTGCGKSMMMDRFFAPSIVPPAGAAATWWRRVHLHEFLIEVHQRAHRLRQETPAMGDPVPYLAYELACETQVWRASAAPHHTAPCRAPRAARCTAPPAPSTRRQHQPWPRLRASRREPPAAGAPSLPPRSWPLSVRPPPIAARRRGHGDRCRRRADAAQALSADLPRGGRRRRDVQPRCAAATHTAVCVRRRLEALCVCAAAQPAVCVCGGGPNRCVCVCRAWLRRPDRCDGFATVRMALGVWLAAALTRWSVRSLGHRGAESLGAPGSHPWPPHHRIPMATEGSRFRGH